MTVRVYDCTVMLFDDYSPNTPAVMMGRELAETLLGVMPETLDRVVTEFTGREIRVLGYELP
jgi:hypothetical protein